MVKRGEWGGGGGRRVVVEIWVVRGKGERRGRRGEEVSLLFGDVRPVWT